MQSAARELLLPEPAAPEVWHFLRCVELQLACVQDAAFTYSVQGCHSGACVDTRLTQAALQTGDPHVYPLSLPTLHLDTDPKLPLDLERPQPKPKLETLDYPDSVAHPQQACRSDLVRAVGKAPPAERPTARLQPWPDGSGNADSDAPHCRGSPRWSGCASHQDAASSLYQLYAPAGTRTELQVSDGGSF